MNVLKCCSIAVALMVLVGGLSAVGAAAPADAAANSDSSLGPSDGLPSPVPDFVSDILGTISSFLDGGIDSLGEALSGFLSSVSGGLETAVDGQGISEVVSVAGGER